MINIGQTRKNTMNGQIRPWGGLNVTANDAIMTVKRELFVPEKYKKLAFSDIQIPLNDKTVMFEPKVEGRILDAVNIQADEKVLEIGTGSGYLTAVMAKLAKSIVSIEIDENLKNYAQEKFNNANITNVKLVALDAANGLNFDDFFDVVIVGCAVPKITGRYFHLLGIGGRIFVIEGTGKVMSAKLITRINQENWQTQTLFETKIDIMQGLNTTKGFKF